MTNVVTIKEANGHAVNGHKALSFQDFWDLFPPPKRVQKALCMAKWEAITSNDGLQTRMKDKDAERLVEIKLKATPEEIIEGLKRSCERWRGRGEQRYGWEDGGKWIPMASTWLNQGRWMD
jgi:NADH:ubiquinone oxidoreductase subunit F (NADH-binding)